VNTTNNIPVTVGCVGVEIGEEVGITDLVPTLAVGDSVSAGRAHGGTFDATSEGLLVEATDSVDGVVDSEPAKP
jgi:hypothetical protein